MDRRHFITGSLGVLAVAALPAQGHKMHESVGLLCLSTEKPNYLRFGANYGSARDVFVFTPSGGTYGHQFDHLFITKRATEVIETCPILSDWFNTTVYTRVAPGGRIVRI